MDLRLYQSDDISTLRARVLEGARRVLFEASVGYGKSVVIEHLAHAYAAAGRPVLVLSNRRAVVDQLRKRARGHELIRVMTVQAADRRRADLGPVDLLLIDEFHMGGAAAQYGRVIEAVGDALVVGFTGTPRPESFEALPVHVEGRGAAWLTDQGFLAPLRYRIPDTPDLSAVRARAGDYVPADLSGAMNRSEIHGRVIESYSDFCRGQPTLGFCVDIAHAVKVADEFRAAGFPAEILTGKDRQEVVEDRIRHLADGGLLLSIDKVSAGFDLPDLRHILALRPTKSEQLWVQQLGRAARAAVGKAHGLIHDHAGNVMRCGTLTESRDWRAPGVGEDRRTEDSERLSIRTCESCMFVWEPGPTVCPTCGHDNGQERRVSVREATRIREAHAAEIEAQRAAQAAQRRDEERGEKTLQDWLRIAAERGYKPGWAYQRHRIRQARRQA